MTIDAKWINRWSERYEDSYDDSVLKVVGPQVEKRGFYDLEDLLAVGAWKLRRSWWPKHKVELESNTDEMIRDVTSTALAAPLPIQHRILTILNGVAVPMASALLTVWNPHKHTVIDVRARNSLVAHNEIPNPAPNTYPLYVEYLAACQSIRQRCGCDLRTLDRALYAANGIGK